jgi:Flp pilus assembly pilin Flp
MGIAHRLAERFASDTWTERGKTLARFLHRIEVALSPRGSHTEVGPMEARPLERQEQQMKQQFQRLWLDEAGQDMVEYALLLVLLTLVVIAALRILGPVIGGFFNEVSDNLNSVT